MKKTGYFYIRSLTTLLLGLGVLLLGTGIASAHSIQPAHAKVLSATPAIGSTVAQAPTTVTVECAENIKPGATSSNLFVYSPAGELISQGNATVSLSNPKEMSINIKPSGDGVYIVRWITVSSDDGDPDEGAFVFTVKAGATATPTPAPTASSTPATTTGNTGSNTGGTPVWATVLIGLVALLVGLGAGIGIGRNTGKATKASSVSSMRRTIENQEAEEENSTKR